MAFDALKFVESIKAPREEYYAKYLKRDEEARGKYRQIAAKPTRMTLPWTMSKARFILEVILVPVFILPVRVEKKGRCRR